MMMLFQLPVTHRIITLDFHENTKEEKGNHHRWGATLWKTLETPCSLCDISDSSRVPSHSGLLRARASCTPIYLDLGLGAIHSETRNLSTNGHTNFGYFASILLAEVLNRAPHCGIKVPSKGDISHIEILNSNGKTTAGRQVLINYLPTRSDASRN